MTVLVEKIAEEGPYDLADVAAGAHTLTLSKPGFAPDDRRVIFR